MGDERLKWRTRLRRNSRVSGTPGMSLSPFQMTPGMMYAWGVRSVQHAVTPSQSKMKQSTLSNNVCSCSLVAASAKRVSAVDQACVGARLQETCTDTQALAPEAMVQDGRAGDERVCGRGDEDTCLLKVLRLPTKRDEMELVPLASSRSPDPDRRSPCAPHVPANSLLSSINELATHCGGLVRYFAAGAVR